MNESELTRSIAVVDVLPAVATTPMAPTAHPITQTATVSALDRFTTTVDAAGSAKGLLLVDLQKKLPAPNP